MFKHFYSIYNSLLIYIKLFFQKKLELIVNKVVSELMQRWKKSYSDGKIEPRERKTKIEICKIFT